MTKKGIERLDLTDSEIEGIKEVQKLPAIERSLAKLSQTFDETVKTLAAIATTMSYWRRRSPASTLIKEGTSSLSKEEMHHSATFGDHGGTREGKKQSVDGLGSE